MALWFVFNKSLEAFNLTHNEHILFIDHHGQKVSDSDKQLSNKIESFANLQCFKSATAGKLGSSIETINGTKMLVAYSPVMLYSTTLAVLLMCLIEASSSDIISNETLNQTNIEKISASYQSDLRAEISKSNHQYYIGDSYYH